MPLDNSIPYRFRPRSLSDTFDGSNAPKGACSNLSNLIPDPSTIACLQCRPAAVDISEFEGFDLPGVVSVAMRVGEKIYGMIATNRNPGKDEPFVFDLTAQAFSTVQNVTAANCPATQPTSGDWTPPTMDMVGSQIFVTHPGFSGAAGGVNAYFGIFDISEFSENITGDIINGSPIIIGNPDISGVFGGMPISGTGIPANSYVINKSNVSISTVGTTNGTTLLVITGSTTGLAVGQQLTGVGIAAGSIIASIAGANITMSLAATGSATGVSIFVAGTTITISQNATATTNGLTIAISGGTLLSPFWTASNTTGNPLAQIPTSIRQFNNRAYFSFGNFDVFTDTLSTNVTSATQALTIGTTDPITAQCPLSVISSTNAIISGLLVYKENSIYLITGDPITNNLDVSPIAPEGVGTKAPRSVTPTPLGVLFVDDDGVRIVQITGNVTDPIDDVRVPFVYAVFPSRISGAYDNGVYRACLQNGNVSGAPFQEFWFDFKYKMWTGPHTFRQDMAVPNSGTFICFSNANPAIMYRSDVVQSANSGFIENGQSLIWSYAPSALPDHEDLMMNSCVVSSINLAFKAGAPQISCIASNEDGTILNSTIIFPQGSSSIWGAFTWGAGLWFGQQFGLKPYQIPWTTALIFSKVIVTFSAISSLGFQISNLQMLYQPLGYVSTPYNAPTVTPPGPTPPLWDSTIDYDASITWQA